MTRTIRVGLVDDEELVCHYLRRILGSAGDIDVVGHALDGAEAVDLVRASQPDVLLMDVRMPKTGGLLALEAVRLTPQPPAVVMFTGYNDERAALRAMRAGAAGLVLKSTAPGDLVRVVRLAAAGHRVLGEGLADIFGGLDAGPPPIEPPGLTAREHDVLELLGEGLANAQIAQRAGLSQATVKGHVSALMVKLGCGSRLQLGLIAQRLRLQGRA